VKFPEISEAWLDNTGHLGENAITFYSGLRILWSWTLWKAYSEEHPFQLKISSKTTRCMCCGKCFSQDSTWEVRFEHRDISKAIHVASPLIVWHTYTQDQI
jgi:hypothetical protein